MVSPQVRRGLEGTLAALSGPTDLQHFGLELLRTAGRLRGAEDRGHRAEVRGRGGCE